MATPAHFAEVEWIAKSADIQVRINTLAPGSATPWHFHTAVTDNIFCLEGEIEVGLRDPDRTETLRPGGRQEISPGRVHRVVNHGDRALRYLLVQATGPYDFQVVASDPAP